MPVSQPGWRYHLQDALGSVRGRVDASAAFSHGVDYDPYGVPDVPVTGFAFTGEPRDLNGLQYHRARYYAPEMGVFTALDAFEGVAARPMSLNGYGWVEGNVVNATDASGLSPECCIAECLREYNNNPSSLFFSEGVGAFRFSDCVQSCLNPPATAIPPQLYPVGIGLRTPTISNPANYGECSSLIDHRPGCAVRTYQAVVADSELRSNGGANGQSLTWELFFALTIAGEGGIFYIDPTLESNQRYQMRLQPDQTSFRLAFESAIVNQLLSACGGNTCTEADFVKYLAGPPPTQWGIEAWYSLAANAVDQTVRRLKGLGVIHYRFFIDNAERAINGPRLQVINWGNPRNLSELDSKTYIGSYISQESNYGKVNPEDPERVYFWIN